DPMTDWLESYLRADERGRARAIARHAPGIGEPQLWFQFEALLETRLPEATEIDASLRRTMRRLGDGYFTPQTVSVWSNGTGPPDTEFKASFLTRSPEHSTGDRPLIADRWACVFDRFPDFVHRANSASAEATARILGDERTLFRIASATEQLE